MGRLPLTSAGYHSIDKFQDCAISLVGSYASVKDLCKLVMVQESVMLLHSVKKLLIPASAEKCKNPES